MPRIVRNYKIRVGRSLVNVPSVGSSKDPDDYEHFKSRNGKLGTYTFLYNPTKDVFYLDVFFDEKYKLPSNVVSYQFVLNGEALERSTTDKEALLTITRLEGQSFNVKVKVFLREGKIVEEEVSIIVV